MPDVFFASQAYNRADYGLPPELCVNMFPETGAAPGTGEPYSLIPREGRKTFATIASETSCQGGFQQDGVASGNLITVHSTRVYSTDKFGASTYIGAIDFPIGPVRFAAIRNSLVILSPSGNAFRTDGSTLAQITDADAPTNISDVQALDQRIIFSDKATDQFFWSEVLDSSNILGLSFATAERNADPIVGLGRIGDALFIGGTETIEFWEGTGNTSESAFQPIPGANPERGVASKHTIINADNSIFFLGDNAQFYRIGEGYVPQRVSTNSIEEKASAEIEAGNKADISCWTYTRGGHEHIGLRLPSQGTFVFDVSTGRWWEAQTYQKDTYQQIFAVQAFNRVLVGEVDSGVISELSPSTFTDNGTTIERIATANTPVKTRTPCANFRVHVVEGVGLSGTGQGTDPLIMLDYSDDGEGKVYKRERRYGIGKIGKYGKRVIARACGQMRPPGRIWRVRITDPVSFALRKASINELD